MKYLLRCPACGEKFPSFEKYEAHVVTVHKDKLGLRMKPEIVRE